jgi:hypothetical protein
MAAEIGDADFGRRHGRHGFLIPPHIEQEKGPHKQPLSFVGYALRLMLRAQ